jgi:site-specific DNA-methyltransferase (adenine-specific)
MSTPTIKLPDEQFHMILQGDARKALALIPNETIDMVVTSPPYLACRSYGTEPQIWDDGWIGELGSEPDYRLYVKHIVAIFHEVKRVLKTTGSLYLNMGDIYARNNTTSGKNILGEQTLNPHPPTKSLMGMPERVMLAMIDDGWILRNKIPWYSRNKQPNSAQDRFSNKWERIFFFTKSNKPQYYINTKTGALTTNTPPGINGIENIDWEWTEKETTAETGEKQYKKSTWIGKDYWFNINALRKPPKYPPEILAKVLESNTPQSGYNTKYANANYGQTLQGLIRDKRTVAIRNGAKKISKELYPNNPKEQHKFINYIHNHYATPLGAAPTDFWLLDENEKEFEEPRYFDIPTHAYKNNHYATYPIALPETCIKGSCPTEVCTKCGMPRETINQTAIKQIPSNCECKAPYRPGIVLDPFGGAGTTALAAKKLGRSSISIELNPEYCQLIKERIGFNTSTTMKWIDIKT